MLCVSQRPLLRIVGMTDTGDELAVFQERVNLREALDLAWRDSFEDVHGAKMARVGQSSPPARPRRQACFGEIGGRERPCRRPRGPFGAKHSASRRRLGNGRYDRIAPGYSPTQT